MQKINPMSFKEDLPLFKEKTAAYYAGELSRGDYKGISGFFGSYAEKGDPKSMLRLRMSAGHVTKEKLKFIADAIRTYDVKMVHFTTCEAVQFHHLNQEQVCSIMEEALDSNIITMGGGGDFPRNVMCSPLSGVEKGEYFDVRPYAEAAADYLMTFLRLKKMPRKLKVCFSNSPDNIPHATFRDLGFCANENHTFDVYSAGGLGNNPKFGVKMAEGIDPCKVLYYIKAMYQTFITYGNYENRGKARTRYMQEILGSPEAYKEAYLKILDETLASGEDLDLTIEEKAVTKTGDGSTISGFRILEQKQEGLYTVKWHPIGGQPKVESLLALSDTIQDMDQVTMFLAPDETAYIANLTGAEAEKVIAATPDSAETIFETSVSCIGASICQQGVCDSQALLRACVDAVRKANVKANALPQIHISGCTSSCGTHQTGAIGFRGAMKKVDGAAQSAFILYVAGNDKQGSETFGRELGTILESRIPAFLVELGQTVALTGLDYESWAAKYPTSIDKVAQQYI